MTAVEFKHFVETGMLAASYIEWLTLRMVQQARALGRRIGEPASLKLLIRRGESEPDRETGLVAGSPMPSDTARVVDSWERAKARAWPVADR
jgi:hypothetical protein